MSTALPDPKAQAARLVEELEVAVAALPAEAALEVRSGIARIGEAIVGRALGEALEAARDRASAPPVPLTLEEAARRMGKSKSWLYHNRKRLGVGFKVGGALRFLEADVERFLMVAARNRRSRRPDLQ